MLNKHPEKSWELAMAKTTKTDDHGLVLDLFTFGVPCLGGILWGIEGWLWSFLGVRFSWRIALSHASQRSAFWDCAGILVGVIPNFGENLCKHE